MSKQKDSMYKIHKLIQDLEENDDLSSQNFILPKKVIKKLLKINKTVAKEKITFLNQIRDLEAKNNSFEDKLPFEHYVNQINENFDFVKIRQFMMATNWNWCIGNGKDGFHKMGIPNTETIKYEAHRLLKEAYDSECQVSSGGFTAFWEDSQLHLIFTIQ